MSENIVFDGPDSGRGLYSAAQCREVDRMAIEEHGIPGFDLMSRAGQRAFDILVRELGSPEQLVVLCGPGNNGGDGYIVADRARAVGIDVQLFETDKPRSGDASQARTRFLENGGSCVELDALQQAQTAAALGCRQEDPEGHIDQGHGSSQACDQGERLESRFIHGRTITS